MSENSQLKMTSALFVKKGDAAPSGYIAPLSHASGLETEADALDPNEFSKEPRVPLTAEFVRRGREFPMTPAGFPTTRPASESATAMPDTTGRDGAGYRERNVSAPRSGTTEKLFRKLLCAPSSMSPVALYSVIFVVGFISFAFALDVSGEFIDMIVESRNQS